MWRPILSQSTITITVMATLVLAERRNRNHTLLRALVCVALQEKDPYRKVSSAQTSHNYYKSLEQAGLRTTGGGRRLS